MNRTHKILLLVLGMGIFGYSSPIQDRAVSFIRDYFDKPEIELVSQKHSIPGEIKKSIERTVQQSFYGDHVYLWEIRDHDTLMGYGMLDNVVGKSMPITFMVIFSPAGVILTSGIIKYREPIGGAVANKRWVNQFAGLNSKSKFKVGDDIDGISGATISVHSVTKGVRKLSLLMEYWIKNKK